jgi:hypothetical protein
MRLLTCKELAFELNRNVTYVYAMRTAGFEMPGGRATVSDAVTWLSRNPEFRRDNARGVKAQIRAKVG